MQFRSLSSTQVAQVVTITITAGSTAGGATWTLTLTDDDGVTHTVTYTETGTETASVIAAGIVAAWNASTQPDVARITAADGGSGAMTFTADTAGRPFSLSISDDSDGTHTGPTTSTSNRGNNDYSDTRNWPGDAIPTTSDDVLIGSTVDVLYGLNQSSVAIADFRVLPDHSAKIGRLEDGVRHYLRIDPDLLLIEGRSSQILLNIGTAAITPTIRHQGRTAVLGQQAILLLGSAMTALNVLRGQVGVATKDGETATIGTLTVSYENNPTGDSEVEMGPGVTLTTAHVDGGLLLLRCAATTVNIAPQARLETKGSGAIGTLNVYGNAVLVESGTVTTANVWGFLDARGKTITTLNEKPGGSILIDDSTSVGTWNELDAPGEFKVTRV